MTEYHRPRAFVREEPRIELIESTLRSLLRLVQLEKEGEVVGVDGFRLRDLEDWRTAPETQLQLNLGSLSTVCNCRCEFCYEEGNPAGLFETKPRFVGLKEARTRAKYLHGGRGLPIESKSTFEALVNPDALSLLRLMRQHDPGCHIEVTTNGALLTEELIAELAALAPVVVHLSLNSADVDVRGRVMRDRRASQARRALELLRAYEIPFVGSIVPWPEQGIDDLDRTIEDLDAHEARTIRMFLPALTRHHPNYKPAWRREWLPRVLERAAELRTRLATPILCSPFSLVTTSFDPIVEGVIRRSPGASAGIRLGDRIHAVDGKSVVSRAHASSLLERALPSGHVTLEIGRGSERFEALLRAPLPVDDCYPYKPRGYAGLDLTGTFFGLCLPGSFHLGYVKRVYDAVVERGARRVLVLVSAHFRELVADLLADLPLPPGVELELVVPENRFFGGDVDIADLWVLEDVAAAVAEQTRGKEAHDLLVMPSSFLSRWGRDLLGVSHAELEIALGLDVAIIQTERIIV